MRLGVIDVGSNTVHLLVVDAHRGGHPLPAFSHKTLLRLSENLDSEGQISQACADHLVSFVTECLEVAAEQGVETLFGFATSAIREAPNGAAVLERVRTQTGVDLQVLGGADEARMTFLAVRRWFGWSSGRVALVDIGGGSLELANGLDEDPDAAVSLPLGAGRITRDLLPAERPSPAEVKAARLHVRATLARQVRPLLTAGRPDRCVGTSKTVRSLGRISGAAPAGDGPYVPRVLTREDVRRLVERLPSMSLAERIELPGVSANRAHQLLAGAIVIEAALDLLGIEQLDICPWALREGLILRRLDAIEG